jgi:uncharacterized membrane protein YeaQ/YmgE (transglycosylase-associated protein family)
VFVLVALAVIIPTVLPFKVPVPISNATRLAYAAVEALDEGDLVILSLGYGPSSLAELQPQANAILRHCFRRKLRVMVMSLWPDAPPLGAKALREVVESDEFADPATGRSRVVEGVDFVDVGYRLGATNVILRMSTDIPDFFDTDARGEPLSSLPVMDGVRGFDDVDLVVDLAAGDSADWWIVFGNGRFGVDVVVGVTGVIVSQMYPYLNSGQLLGLIGGGVGAAEYEALVGAPGAAMKRVSTLSIVHALVIALVVLGNVIYLRQRRSGGETA